MDDDELVTDTLFTLQDLLLDCPEEFDFCGTSYSGEVETAWHNDESVPVNFQVRDSDYDYCTGYATEPMPTWGEVLWDIAHHLDADAIDPDRWRLILQAEWERYSRKRVKLLDEVAVLDTLIADMDKRLAKVTPVDKHASALLRAFGDAP